ncbi:hypothetical protein [Plantactinospora endophytica]|uniref:hypothetical protein n=1 Tax=Plantactinospora endophytica TaxID=673535 RepID=UPI0019440B26|nr:hypothetical protein [Plantactinospora endophytica]
MRFRQGATLAAAAAVVAAVGVVPVVMTVGGSSPASDAVGQVSGASPCPTLSSDNPGGELQTLGPLVETGATLDAPNLDARYDVLIGLVGTRDQPGFVVAFRDRHTRVVQVWDNHGLGRDSSGDFAGKRAGEPAHQFFSAQLALGPDRVLDVGLYSRAAHRITVSSEGHPTDAESTRNTATGWTFFWVQRSARPLPPDRFTSPGDYQGPEKVTVAAYDAAGRPQHTDSGGPHVGGGVQNPRDGSPSAQVTPSPTAPACPTGVVPS